MGFELLCNINRFSNCHFIEPESDAEHTIRMQLKLLNIVNDLYNGGVKTPPFDIKKLVYNILLHDCDEIVLCDCPRDLKYYDSDIKSKINDISKELLHKSKINSKLIMEITSELKDDSVEGLLLSYLDVESAVDKLNREHAMQIYAQDITQRLKEAKANLEWYLNNKLDLIKDPDLHKIIEDRINERIR